MMCGPVVMQELVTISGRQGTGIVLVPGREAVVRVGHARTATACAEVMRVTTGMDLTLETAVARDGPWFTLLPSPSGLPVGASKYLFGRDSGFAVDYRIAEFIRWKISGSPAGVWYVCFRLSVSLEVPVARPRRNS